MKTVILDGSNIIRSMYNSHKGFDFAKEKVLSDSLVKAMEYLNEGGYKYGDEVYHMEIYFDGPTREVYRPSELVEVIFSKRKEADNLIVNSVYESTNSYGNQVLVVTRDNGLRDLCKECGAQVMHTYTFLSKCSDLIKSFAVVGENEVVPTGEKASAQADEDRFAQA